MIKKILIVEDQRIVQMGLEILIKESLRDIEMDFASNFPSALELAETKLFDLIILDINIPGGENSRMFKKFRSIQPHVKIIVFTGLQEKLYASYYIQAGADGFVSKINDETNLIKVIKKTLSDSNSYSLKIDQDTINFDPLSELSTREYEVMSLMIQGKFTKDIASGMKLKATTISTYKSRIYGKLNVDNVIDLVKKVQMFKSVI